MIVKLRLWLLKLALAFPYQRDLEYGDDWIYDPELRLLHRAMKDIEHMQDKLKIEMEVAKIRGESQLVYTIGIEQTKTQMELSIAKLRYRAKNKELQIRDQIEGRIGKDACDVFSPIFIHSNYPDRRPKRGQKSS